MGTTCTSGLMTPWQVPTAPLLGWRATGHASSPFTVNPLLKSFHWPNMGHPQCKEGTKFFLEVSMSIQGCLPLSPLPSYSWHKFLPCGKYVPPRGWSSISPHPIFWCHIFPARFGTKLVSITFSLRPEEALLVLTLQKLVLIHV